MEHEIKSELKWAWSDGCVGLY